MEIIIIIGIIVGAYYLLNSQSNKPKKSVEYEITSSSEPSVDEEFDSVQYTMDSMKKIEKYLLPLNPHPLTSKRLQHRKINVKLMPPKKEYKGELNVMDWYSFEFYGGTWESDYSSTKRGLIGDYRLICKSENIMSDEDWADFSINYNDFEYIYQNDGSPTGFPTLNADVKRIKNLIKNDFIDTFNKYNKETKEWQDFDITNFFLQIRHLMITSQSAREYPHYVWQFIDGNPFDRVYRICRDYMKWKATFRTTKILFENVQKWENGNIHREDEPALEFEKPTYIKWSRVAKDFLSMKTKLKKEDKGGLEWLKTDFSNYIIERASFYKEFGEQSPYYIKDEIIEKCKNLK